MTTWAEAHRQAAVLAAQLRADLDIPRDRPVNVFDAVERLGLVLAFAPLGRVSGLYIPGGRSPGILIHDGHPRTRQRYTAGHELGHYAFGHGAEVDIDLETALQRGDVDAWPDQEKEAEAFGAWFLMPRQLLSEGLSQLGIAHIESPYEVYALALWLGTSYTATTRQLSATRLVDVRQADSWAQIPPRAIKKSLAGELVPNDLRNDVWWLNGHHTDFPVEARPGDRLVLTLDEIPSSGYSWRFARIPDDVHVLADSYDDDWEPQIGDENQSPEEVLAGNSHPRSFVLEIDSRAARGTERLTMVKDQPWETTDTSDELQLVVSVNPPLHGIQVSEREFALAV